MPELKHHSGDGRSQHGCALVSNVAWFISSSSSSSSGGGSGWQRRSCRAALALAAALARLASNLVPLSASS